VIGFGGRFCVGNGVWLIWAANFFSGAPLRGVLAQRLCALKRELPCGCDDSLRGSPREGA